MNTIVGGIRLFRSLRDKDSSYPTLKSFHDLLLQASSHSRVRGICIYINRSQQGWIRLGIDPLMITVKIVDPHKKGVTKFR